MSASSVNVRGIGDFPFATKLVGTSHYQKIALDLGDENTAQLLTSGQKTMALSLPVVLASDQSAIPVSISGTGAINISQWGGVATSLGQKAESASAPVVLATEQDTAKATSVNPGNVTGVGVWDLFNEQWWPWPANGQGTPFVFAYGDDGAGNQTAFTIRVPEPTYADPGLYTRNIESRPVQTSDSITFVGDTAQLSVINYNSLVFSISGTYGSVNLTFEGSIDGGTTWGTVQVRRIDSSTIETVSGSLTNTTRFWRVSVDAFTHFRARATAWGSGTATIRFSASFQPHDPIVAASDVSLNGGYTTVYIDGAAVIQQDTLTSFYNVMPAGGWDAGMGGFAALPLTNSGATVPVEVTGTVVVSSNTATLANVARGKINAASLTGSYATLLVMGGQGRVVHLYNSTDQPVLFSLDNATTDSIELDAGENYVVDWVANGLVASSSTIKAKYVSTAPSVGSVRAIIARS